MPKNLQNVYVAGLVFVLTFTIYFSSQKVIQSTDSVWAIHIAMSIIKEGNTNLDEYAEIITERDYYGVEKIDDHIYSVFPLGASVLAVPFIFIIDKLSHLFWPFDLYDHLLNIRDIVALRLELFVASVIAALACSVIYLLGRLSLDKKKSLLFLFLFAFCTAIWSTASRALWQHGPSVLMLSIALYLILAAKNRPELVQFVSIPLAFAYMIRPTNSISIIFITSFVLIKYRKYFLKYIFWGLLIAIPFLAFNFSVYHNLLQPYYLPQRLSFSNATFGEALIGNLISPARGLFVYSSIFLFVGYGIVIKMKDRQSSQLDGCLLCILFFHWLSISSFPHWWGGYSFGPRFFTDMIPYLMYFLVPVINNLFLTEKKSHVLFLSSFCILISVSFFINWRGATSLETFTWNIEHKYITNNVDQDPGRLWNWQDPPFLRGLWPANISIVEQNIYTKSVQRETRSESSPIIEIRASNIGDQPLALKIETPHRINLDSHNAQNQIILSGMSSLELKFSIDVVGYNPGVYSFGAIYIAGESLNGKPVRNSPMIIPLTVELAPSLKDLSYQFFLPIVYNSNESQSEPVIQEVDMFIPPVDIVVDGHKQLDLSDEVSVVHGSGWYDMEQIDNFTWRWAMSPAKIYIYSPRRQTIRIESMPVALHNSQTSEALGDQNMLYIKTYGQNDIEFLVHAEKVFSVPIQLQSGWNGIIIESEAGNFIPAEIDPSNGDARRLSFAWGKINIVTE